MVRIVFSEDGKRCVCVCVPTYLYNCNSQKFACGPPVLLLLLVLQLLKVSQMSRNGGGGGGGTITSNIGSTASKGIGNVSQLGELYLLTLVLN